SRITVSSWSFVFLTNAFHADFSFGISIILPLDSESDGLEPGFDATTDQARLVCGFPALFEQVHLVRGDVPGDGVARQVLPLTAGFSNLAGQLLADGRVRG